MQNLAEDVRSAHLQSFRILYCDEMMVTKRSIPKSDWSLKYKNTGLDFNQLNNGAIAVLAAVSREKGVELVMTFKRSVNVPKFKVFLEELRRRNPFDSMLIVFDNLAVHRHQHVLQSMEEGRHAGRRASGSVRAPAAPDPQARPQGPPFLRRGRGVGGGGPEWHGPTGARP